MMITLILILLLTAIGLVWYGWREESILVFTIAFVTAVVTFVHHMTDVIGLSL